MSEHELAFVVAGLTAIGLGISIIFNIITTLRSRKERTTNTVIRLGNELTRIMEREYSLKKEHSLLYAIIYLECLDRIAYLQHLDKLPKYSIVYFKKYFRYGKTLWNWYKKHGEEEVISEHWPYFEDWVSKRNIQPFKDSLLPKVLQNYDN